MAGTWIAEVAAFQLPQGPQRFSLIGAALVPLPIHATSLCERFPLLCRKLWLRPDVCERYPRICATRISVSRPGLLRIGFSSLKQKVALPLDAICRTAVSCACNAETGCKDVTLRLESAEATLHAAVYTAKGKLVTRGTPANREQRLRFSTLPGEHYFVVLAPGRGMRTDRDYPLSLRME